MSYDLIPRIKRFTTDYRRGSYRDTEYVSVILQTLIDDESSNADVEQAFMLIPDGAIPALETQLNELVNDGFYVRATFLGDTRSEDEIRRASHNRQPTLRRIHRALLRAILVRRIRLAHGFQQPINLPF